MIRTCREEGAIIDNTASQIEDTFLSQNYALGWGVVWGKTSHLKGHTLSCLCHFLVQNKVNALILCSWPGVTLYSGMYDILPSLLKLPHLDSLYNCPYISIIYIWAVLVFFHCEISGFFHNQAVEF